MVMFGNLFGEDYNLQYKDFKDNTHIAETGALHFMKEFFKNISRHSVLQVAPLESLYLCRVSKKTL